MAVYREGFHAVCTITAGQARIFNDACDYGTPTTKGDRVWNLAQQLTAGYGIEGTRKVDRYATGVTVTQQVQLIDEWAVFDRRKTLAQATETYQVTFTSCTAGLCKGCTGYITIERIA